MDQAERTLWTLQNDDRSVQCVMRSCCAGAKLQVLMTRVMEGEPPTVVLRELYPTKSDLFERARLLEAYYRDENGRTGGLSPPLAGSVDDRDSDRPV